MPFMYIQSRARVHKNNEIQFQAQTETIKKELQRNETLKKHNKKS